MVSPARNPEIVPLRWEEVLGKPELWVQVGGHGPQEQAGSRNPGEGSRGKPGPWARAAAAI
eukprot:6957935-Alexandrium_andersonii.AAC.1